MRKKIFSLLFLLILTGCSANTETDSNSDAVNRNDGRDMDADIQVTADAGSVHSAVLEISGENPYKSIRLTPQIYNASNSDLSDILVRDADGEPVPYFIHSGLVDITKSLETYLLTLTNSYVRDDSYYFDYALASPPDSDVIATSITFSTVHNDFAKMVEIYGSYDDINWEYVQNDTLYVIDGMTKLAAAFAEPQKYTHYRLKLMNNLEQISFEEASLIYSHETTEEAWFIETIDPQYEIQYDDKSTEIILTGLRNLRLCDIAIDTDSMFKRNVRTDSGIEKEIYNLSLNGTSYADTTIPLNRQISENDAFILTIEDADDNPVDIKGITVRYYADEIVFEGNRNRNENENKSMAYILEFGRGPYMEAPVYDIERYKEEILKGTIDRLAIGEISYAAESSKPVPDPDYKWVFNLVVIVITLLLGTVILHKLKKTP